MARGTLRSWMVDAGLSLPVAETARPLLARKYTDCGWLRKTSFAGRHLRQRHSTGKPACSRCNHIINYKVHAGGITALGEYGYRHYLPLGGTVQVALLVRLLSVIPAEKVLALKGGTAINYPAQGDWSAMGGRG